MQNPDSAIERIKNHLAYKIGQAMIDYKINNRSYWYLIKKIYRIKKQHKQEMITYKSVTQVFPSLKYPKLDSCLDYNEALKYKFHLSYLLGEILIRTHKNWYKGEYLFLLKNIKIAKKEFNFFKELILNNAAIFNNLLSDKKIFFKKIQKIQNILEKHQDYKAIIDNIFHNFNYFIQNFDLIEEWLLSNDFYEKYKKENHPYPSLLDPKKLNDKNEIINYENISEELAWEMNLPLPDNYKFVCLGFGLSGHAALSLFLSKSLPLVYFSTKSPENIYKFQKKSFLFLCVHFQRDVNKTKELLHKIHKQPVLFLTRDPIERLKHGISHGWYAHSHQKPFDKYNIKEHKIDEILNRVQYVDIKDWKTLLNSMDHWINNACFNYNTMAKCIHSKIIYLDMKDILPDKAFNTMHKLSRLLKFNPPKKKNRNFYEEIKNSNFRYILPIILIYNDIEFYITLKNEMKDSFINIEKYFNFKNHATQYICFAINPINESRLLNIANDKYLKNFFDDFLIAINKKVTYIEKTRMTANRTLWCLKKDEKLREKFKNILKQELKHIKQAHPEIVISWKYYQDFEKMYKKIKQKP
ncbi:TPA: DUF2972 domain-containing protein [Campylobacter coli]|nr:DUF2972 domain-containing protein [Campylobacter coli]